MTIISTERQEKIVIFADTRTSIARALTRIGRSRTASPFEVMRDLSVRQALTADQHFVQAGFRALLRE